MQRLIIFLSLTFCALTCLGEAAPKFELLTPGPAPLFRRGGNAVSGSPEFSPDGSNVLYLSAAANLTADPDAGALNLYLVNLQTRVTTLISVGTNGAPANDSIEGFQISPDNRKVLFETRASNIVANDTNNRTDVFLRNLDTGTTILISVDTDGLPAGGYDGSMTPDGSRVVYISGSLKIASPDRNLFDDVFLRDVAQNRSELVSVGPVTAGRATGFPSISDDGRYVVFDTDPAWFPNYRAGFNTRVFLRDLEAQVTTRVAADVPGTSLQPFLSADGRYITFGTFSYSGSSRFEPLPPPRSPSPYLTNTVMRYNIQSAALELISSNSVGTTLMPLGISTNGETIVYFRPSEYEVWREGLPVQSFPKSLDGSPVVTFPSTSLDLSADGKFAVFTSLATNLVDFQSRTGPQVYAYNIETDALSLLSPFNDTNGVTDFPADPVISANGSHVAYVAESDRLDGTDRPTPNIHLWTRATGESELLSRALTGSFQVSQHVGSSHAKRFSISDDGQRVVFQSLEPVDERTKTNPVWNVFLFDRATKQKQLISRSADGLGGGNMASYGAIISGNGQSIAWFSRSTNLISEPLTNDVNIYVRDLASGRTLVANNPGLFENRSRNPKYLSWSRDGRLLAYSSDGLRSGNGVNVYLFDVTEGAHSLVTAQPGGTAVSIAGIYNPTISPDARFIVFQMVSGTQLGFLGSYPAIVWERESKHMRLLSSSSSGGGTNEIPTRFNSDSTAVFVGGSQKNSAQICDLIAKTNQIVVTNFLETDISADFRYVTFSRGESDGRKQVYLRSLSQSSEIAVTGAGNNHSYDPHLTGDGGSIVFASRASNLVSNDYNNDIDLFRFDRVAGRIELITRNGNGNSANRASQRPVLSGDSSTIFFKTFASDLVQGDFNEAPDLLAYAMPMLRITSYQVVSGKLRLVWDAAPGQTYRVQSRESLTSGDWGDEPSISGEVDVPSTGARFYRVVSDN